MKLIVTVCLLVCLLNSCINPPGTKQIHVENTSKSDSIKQIVVELNQILNTDFFDVTLKKYWVLPEVNTGNEYTSLPKQADIKFLVLRLNFKNIDTESRNISFGQVFISYNGKDYKFDQPEQIFDKGWETGMEQINPLTSMTRLVAYKLPKEIIGPVFYHPGRTDDRHFIKVCDLSKEYVH